MTGPSPSSPEPRLTLQSQLEDLTLVWPWVEALAVRYSIPADTQFAIQPVSYTHLTLPTTERV